MKCAVGLNINDPGEKWSPGAHMPQARGSIHEYFHNIQTSSPLKLLSQSKPILT